MYHLFCHRHFFCQLCIFVVSYMSNPSHLVHSIFLAFELHRLRIKLLTCVNFRVSKITVRSFLKETVRRAKEQRGARCLDSDVKSSRVYDSVCVTLSRTYTHGLSIKTETGESSRSYRNDVLHASK